MAQAGERRPIVVIGAGAAGILAAIFAGGSGRPVLLLERTRDGGRKILISGGGRCNILPSALGPERFVTASSPNTLRKILGSWPLDQQRRFFESEVGLPLALETSTGKLFPASNSARQVRDRLLSLATRRGVTTRFQALVIGLEQPVRRETGSGAAAWTVRLDGGESIEASRVILASGGLSVPTTGSDGIGLDLARRLGHTIHDTYPALTPLTAEPHPYPALAGVSAVVTLRAPGAPRAQATTRGGFLVTHRGFSGPAVLDISHLAVLSRRAGGPLQPILVQWTDRGPDDWDRLLRGGRGGILSVLRRQLPARLAEALLAGVGIEADRALSQLRREERRRLVERLARDPLPWTGDEGYGKAEVTGGGVALGEIEPRTLESRIHPGLFLCGEILDAFGPIGGYNFAWAWATGRAAGLGAAGPPI
ncbi:MAG TPA: aminoacetone oxidase family FAD-binding enzyme [Candidatus Polarisedimenticolia bacterium]|nr:aminoacetone oxidase family FAD-binding enzyme [Candidatus Polarisedimenticolia bacterium]